MQEKYNDMRGDTLATTSKDKEMDATRKIERQIKDIRRELNQAKGRFDRAEVVAYEQAQEEVTIKKLLKKIGQLEDELDELEGWN